MYKVIRSLGEYLEFNFVKCVGGKQIRDNFMYPDRPTILIGTMGKLLDIFERNLLKSQKINIKIINLDFMRLGVFELIN